MDIIYYQSFSEYNYNSDFKKNIIMNSALLHTLFKDFLVNGISKDSYVTLIYFSKMIENKNKFKNIKQLIDASIKTQIIIDNSYDRYKFSESEYSNEYKINKFIPKTKLGPEYYHRKEDIIPFNILNDKFFLKQSKPNVYTRLYYTLINSPKKHGEELQKLLILYTTIKDECIIPTGWESTYYHTIPLYYIKNNDHYDVYIFNNGRGYKNYAVYKCSLNKNDLKELLGTLIVFKRFASFKENDNEAEEYYSIIHLYFKKDITYYMKDVERSVTHENSYNGYYLLVKFLLKQDFNEFDLLLKEFSYENVINMFDYNICVTDHHKNMLEFMKFNIDRLLDGSTKKQEYEDNINKLFDKYIKNVKECTTYTTPSFKQEQIIKSKILQIEEYTDIDPFYINCDNLLSVLNGLITFSFENLKKNMLLYFVIVNSLNKCVYLLEDKMKYNKKTSKKIIDELFKLYVICVRNFNERFNESLAWIMYDFTIIIMFILVKINENNNKFFFKKPEKPVSVYCKSPNHFIKFNLDIIYEYGEIKTYKMYDYQMTQGGGGYFYRNNKNFKTTVDKIIDDKDNVTKLKCFLMLTNSLFDDINIHKLYDANNKINESLKNIIFYDGESNLTKNPSGRDVFRKEFYKDYHIKDIYDGFTPYKSNIKIRKKIEELDIINYTNQDDNFINIIKQINNKDYNTLNDIITEAYLLDNYASGNFNRTYKSKYLKSFSSLHFHIFKKNNYKTVIDTNILNITSFDTAKTQFNEFNFDNFESIFRSLTDIARLYIILYLIAFDELKKNNDNLRILINEINENNMYNLCYKIILGVINDDIDLNIVHLSIKKLSAIINTSYFPYMENKDHALFYSYINLLLKQVFLKNQELGLSKYISIINYDDLLKNVTENINYLSDHKKKLKVIGNVDDNAARIWLTNFNNKSEVHPNFSNNNIYYFISIQKYENNFVKNMSKITHVTQKGSHDWNNTFYLIDINKKIILESKYDRDTQYNSFKLIKCNDIFFNDNYILTNVGDGHFYNLSILGHYTSHHYFYDNILNEYILYFEEIRNYDTGEKLLFKINTKIFLLLNNNEYEIVTEEKGLFNRWIYNIPYAFFIKIGSSLKIIYFYMMTFFSNVWNTVDPSKIPFEKYEYLKNRYFIADVHYNGLQLNFPNKDAEIIYQLLCTVFAKQDCLLSLGNKYMYDEYFNSPMKEYFNQLYDVKKIEYSIESNVDFNERPKIRNFNNKYINKQEYFSNKYTIFKTNIKFKDQNVNFDKLKNLSDKFKVENGFNDEQNKLLDEYKQKIIGYDDFEPLSKNYIEENINKFNKKYRKCDNIPDLTNDVNIDFDIKASYDNLFSNIAKSDKHLLTTLYDNYTHLYNILNYHIIKNMKKEIDNLKESDYCMEHKKKIHDMIDNEVIYTGPRSIEIILLELLLGYYIRIEQYEIYKKITDSIDNSESYYLYQLLMGRGKTSTIMPLVMLKYLLNFNENINNVIIILPSHLIRQTYDDINKNLKLLMCNYPLIKYDDITRVMINEKQNINTCMNYIYSLNDTEYNYNAVFLMDDTSVKTLKLNSLLCNNTEDTIVIQNNSVLIFDEFDSIYDPLSSDLNFPEIEQKLGYIISKKNYPINDKTIDFLIDIIYFIMESNIKDIYTNFKDNGLFYHKIIEYSDGNKNIYKSALEVININELIKIYSDSEIKQIIMWEKLFTTINDCLNLIYNKDYGFPSEKSHTDHFITVPYSAVNNPVPKSKFSDLDINLILIIMTYIQSEIRIKDINKTIIHIEDYNKALRVLLEHKEIVKLVKEYINILGVTDINDIGMSNNVLNKYTEYANDNNLEGYYYIKKEYVKKYLMEIIIPNFTVLKSFHNCSTIDIISKYFSNYKTGFSGTMNIKLPKLDDYENEFVEPKPIEEDNGSIFCALLGIIHQNYYIEHIDTDKDKKLILKDIIDIIIKNSYNVFIDTGAFLRGYESIDVIKEIVNAVSKDDTINFNKFIYINKDDKKLIYDTESNNPKKDYNNERFKTNDVFIYYDNKHIVGIDIKQPYKLKGFASVNKFNRLTDISQGIFRMRELNYGHTVDYVVNMEMKIDNKIDLLNRLLKKEHRFITVGSEAKKLEQHLSLIKKSTNFNDIENFKFNNFDYYLTIKNSTVNNEIIELNHYVEHIKKIYSKLNKISLLNEFRDVYTKINKTILNKNQEKEKEKEEEEEKKDEEDLQKSKLIEQDNSKKLLIRNIFSKHKINIIDYVEFNINKFKAKQYMGEDANDTIITKKVIEDINKLGIYFSPLFNFCTYKVKVYDQFIKKKKYDIKYDITTENAEKLLLKLLYNYNYYYIKKDDKYILLSPSEYSLIIGHLKSIDYSNITIKHKDGTIKYGNKEDKNTNKEYFVKLILAQDLNILEYIELGKYFSENKINIDLYKNIINYIVYNYALIFYNINLFDSVINTDYNVLIKQLLKESPTKIIKKISHMSITLTPEADNIIKKKIKELFGEIKVSHIDQILGNINLIYERKSQINNILLNICIIKPYNVFIVLQNGYLKKIGEINKNDIKVFIPINIGLDDLIYSTKELLKIISLYDCGILDKKNYFVKGRNINYHVLYYMSHKEKTIYYVIQVSNIGVRFLVYISYKVSQPKTYIEPNSLIENFKKYLDKIDDSNISKHKNDNTKYLLPPQ